MGASAGRVGCGSASGVRKCTPEVVPSGLPKQKVQLLQPTPINTSREPVANFYVRIQIRSRSNFRSHHMLHHFF